MTDGVELEAAYTGATRGRHENHLYVPHADLDHLDHLDHLAHQLKRSGAKELAIEHER